MRTGGGEVELGAIRDQSRDDVQGRLFRYCVPKISPEKQGKFEGSKEISGESKEKLGKVRK